MSQRTAGSKLNKSAKRTKLMRYRVNPVLFIEEVLINPETGKPFKLLKAEKSFSGMHSSAAEMVACSIPNRSMPAQRNPARPPSLRFISSR
jgi:hypothetical protein